MLSSNVATGLQAVLEWIRHQWPLLVTIGTALFAFEKWRGQRLGNRKLGLESAKLHLENEKLALEVKALSLALRSEELERVAQEITGKGLPETGDAPAAFRALLEEWAQGRALAELHAELDALKDKLAASHAERAA